MFLGGLLPVESATEFSLGLVVIARALVRDYVWFSLYRFQLSPFRLGHVYGLMGAATWTGAQWIIRMVSWSIMRVLPRLLLSVFERGIPFLCRRWLS